MEDPLLEHRNTVRNEEQQKKENSVDLPQPPLPPIVHQQDRASCATKQREAGEGGEVSGAHMRQAKKYFP